MNPIIKNLESEYTTRELPDMNPGDTVRVFVKIVEGNKERIQAYEGTIIAEHGSGINKTITVIISAITVIPLSFMNLPLLYLHFILLSFISFNLNI